MNEETVKKILIISGSILMVFFCLAPFLYMIYISFSLKPETALGGEMFFTLVNFRDVLTRDSLHFVDYLRNSLIVSFVSAVVGVFIASVAAYGFTRLVMPGKMYILFGVLAVSMFPQISLLGYLFKLMTALGWINTYWALFFPYISWLMPLSVWILVSYFSQIPKELDRAALVDGCSRWQVLFRVILPVAKPGIFSVFLLAFIFAFNEFMFALMLTTDYRARTVPVGIALFEGLHGQIPWGNIMAASVVTTLPVIVLTLIFQKQIVGGLTRGAVKG